MYRIAIIGVGQLGSRHLQAMVNLKIDAELFAVDPSTDSLQLAMERWKEVGGDANQVHFLERIEKLPSQIDLAIVATSSSIRKEVVEELVAEHSIQYLILEKFLFQKENDYRDVQELLRKKKISCWVNCPRRLYPDYKKLKKDLAAPIIMNV